MPTLGEHSAETVEGAGKVELAANVIIKNRGYNGSIQIITRPKGITSLIGVVAIKQMDNKVDRTTGKLIKGLSLTLGTPQNNTNLNPRRLPEGKIHRGSHFTGNSLTFPSRHNSYMLSSIDYYRRKNFRRKEKCKKLNQLLL